jgi:RNA polymerase sigma-70 factor, ECF subfamily
MFIIDDSKVPDPAGDDRLDEAFQRLRPRLLAFIGRRIGKELAVRIDPEGVVQEAYQRAQRRWRAMTTKPSKPDAFVRDQVLDRLIEVTRAALGREQDVRKAVRFLFGTSGDLADGFVDSHTGPKTALSKAERREMVRATLDLLDPDDREILVLRYFVGLSFADIGEILDSKVNTVNQSARRALIKFSKLMPVAFRPSPTDRS